MTVKESKELSLLAKVANKKESLLSIEVFPELLKAGLVNENSDYWGLSVKESIPGNKGIIHVFRVMERLGIKSTSKNYDLFVNLVFILDGECPECGYEMEVIDGEYKHTFGDGYNSPIEYETVWQEKKCLHCGYRMSNEPN